MRRVKNEIWSWFILIICYTKDIRNVFILIHSQNLILQNLAKSYDRKKLVVQENFKLYPLFFKISFSKFDIALINDYRIFTYITIKIYHLNAFNLWKDFQKDHEAWEVESCKFYYNISVFQKPLNNNIQSYNKAGNRGRFLHHPRKPYQDQPISWSWWKSFKVTSWKTRLFPMVDTILVQHIERNSINYQYVRLFWFWTRLCYPKIKTAKIQL